MLFMRFGLDYVSAELWVVSLFCFLLFTLVPSSEHVPFSVQVDAVLLAQTGDKINSNGITGAGWIESAFDEPTSQERINRGSRRRVLRCAYWFSRVSGLPALIGLCFWLVLSLVRIFFFLIFFPHLVAVP